MGTTARTKANIDNIENSDTDPQDATLDPSLTIQTKRGSKMYRMFCGLKTRDQNTMVHTQYIR